MLSLHPLGGKSCGGGVVQSRYSVILLLGNLASGSLG
jgi:hypothetical protein